MFGHYQSESSMLHVANVYFLCCVLSSYMNKQQLHHVCYQEMLGRGVFCFVFLFVLFLFVLLLLLFETGSHISWLTGNLLYKRGDFELLTHSTSMLGLQACAVTHILCSVNNQTKGSHMLDKHCIELHSQPMLLDICIDFFLFSFVLL